MLEERLNFLSEQEGEGAGERKGTEIKGISVFYVEEDDVEVSRC